MAQTKEYQRSAAANFHARRASHDDQPRAPRLSPRSASLSPWLAEGSDQRESCRRTPSPSTRQSLQSLQCNCNVSTIYRFTGPMMRQGGDLRTATLLMVECGPPREGGPKFTASRVPGEAFGPCSSAAGPARRGLSLEVTAGSGRPCMGPRISSLQKIGKKMGRGGDATAGLVQAPPGAPAAGAAEAGPRPEDLWVRARARVRPPPAPVPPQARRPVVDVDDQAQPRPWNSELRWRGQRPGGTRPPVPPPRDRPPPLLPQAERENGATGIVRESGPASGGELRPRRTDLAPRRPRRRCTTDGTTCGRS